MPIMDPMGMDMDFSARDVFLCSSLLGSNFGMGEWKGHPEPI